MKNEVIGKSSAIILSLVLISLENNDDDIAVILLGSACKTFALNVKNMSIV